MVTLKYFFVMLIKCIIHEIESFVEAFQANDKSKFHVSSHSTETYRIHFQNQLLRFICKSEIFEKQNRKDY